MNGELIMESWDFSFSVTSTQNLWTQLGGNARCILYLTDSTPANVKVVCVLEMINPRRPLRTNRWRNNESNWTRAVDLASASHFGFPAEVRHFSLVFFLVPQGKS